MKNLICKFLGHDFKIMKVEKSDGKTYEINYCLRCDKEIHKEVK